MSGGASCWDVQGQDRFWPQFWCRVGDRLWQSLLWWYKLSVTHCPPMQVWEVAALQRRAWRERCWSRSKRLALSSG